MARILCCTYRNETRHRLAYKDAEVAATAADARFEEHANELDANNAPPTTEETKARHTEIDVSQAMQYNITQRVEMTEAQNEDGPASAYFDKFKSSPKLMLIHTRMREGRDREGPNGLNDFTLWTTPTKRIEAAMLFDDQYGALFMPRGAGRKAFVAGLRAPQGTDMYNESDIVLRKIIANLQARVDVENRGKAALEKQATTPVEGHTLNGFINNFKNTFNRASTTESWLLAGAIGAVVYYGWSKKDSTLPFAEKMTYGEAALMAAMFGGINILSGAFSKDGKTLMNRFGTGVDAGVPDIEDPFMRNYAYEMGMDKNNNKLKAFTTCMNLDMRHLFGLYREATDLNSTKRSIDITRLGLAPGIIDGEELYKIIDEVVSKTAENQIKTQYMLERGMTNESQIDWNELHTIIGERKLNTADKIGYFEDKYNSESVAQTNQSLFQVVINENFNPETKYEKLVAVHDEKTGINRVIDGVKYAGLASAEWIEKTAAPYVMEKSGKFYSYMNEEVLTPAGEFIEREYKTYAPKISGFVKEKLSALAQGKVERVLDPKLHGDVTSYAPNTGIGVITVKGVPGFALSVKTDENNKEVITIGEGDEAVAFDGSKDVNGNKKNSEKIDAIATQKIHEAYKKAVTENSKADFLANKDLEWNATKGIWTVKNVEAPVYSEGGVAYDNQPVECVIKPDASGNATFEINGKPLNDIENLAKNNLEAIIQNAIKADSTFEEIADLPVQLVSVESHGTSYKVNITIAGLKASIVPRDYAGAPNNKINLAFAFLDETGTPQLGLTALKLTKENGADAFLKSKAEQIITSRKFNEPFIILEHLANRTDESLWERAKDGSITGPIKERKWKTLLDHKKVEALEMYKYLLANGSAADMEDVYRKTVQKTLNDVSRIESSMSQVSDTDRKENFESYLQDLEKAGYSNEGYIQMFKEYKAMISQFNSEEASWDSPLLALKSDRYRVYQQLLLIWSVNTRDYLLEDPETHDPANLSQKTKLSIKTNIINVIEKKLKACATDGNLTADNMIPKPNSIPAAKEWIRQDN